MALDIFTTCLLVFFNSLEIPELHFGQTNLFNGKKIIVKNAVYKSKSSLKAIFQTSIVLKT